MHMIQKQPYFIQFLVLLAVVVAFFIVAQIVSVLVFFVGGGSLADLMSGGDMENIGMLKAMQIVAQLFIFVVPVFVFSYLKTNNWFQYPQFKLPISIIGLLFTFLILLFSFPIIGQLNLWNQAIELPEALSGIESLFRTLEEQAKEMTEAFLKMDNVFDLLVNLVMVGFLAGLGEELLFRGTIQKFLTEWTKNPHFAIIFTGFVFSAIHLQFYGFFPRWALGILFGYIFYWSGNIWIPIIAHALFNGSQVLVYYVVGENSSFMSDLESIESVTADQKLALGITALVCTVILTVVLRQFYRYSQHTQSIMAYQNEQNENRSITNYGKELDENI